MAHFIPKLQYKNKTLTGTTTISTAVITGLSSTSDLSIGMTATGTGIPTGAKILTVDSNTQVTLDANATASGSTSINFYFEIVFDYPPIEPHGEKLDSKERVSISIAGIRQVSIDFIEAFRTLNFSFLSTALKDSLQTFFTIHGYRGNSFRYFDDKTSASYIEYELADLKFDPKKITSKGANNYIWEVGLKFRRVL